MYEEWFEKLALELNITKVVQNDREVEIELPEDVSNKQDGDKLFLTVYNINSKFLLSYRNKKIYIKLKLANLPKHFIYYLVPLLEFVKGEYENS